MPNAVEPQAGQVDAAPAETARSTKWQRLKRALDWCNDKFHYIVSLPIAGALGTVLVAHFQYQSAYDDKVKQVSAQEIKAAEQTFADVAKSFSTAITLQQLVFFNYKDAHPWKKDAHPLKEAGKPGADASGDTLEAKNAKALYPKYDELRTMLRENIDMMARRVEVDLDWASNINRDAAKSLPIDADPMSRIKLGAYDFECDKNEHMPKFGSAPLVLEPKTKGDKALYVDWNSAKHELLTLYFCFNHLHERIEPARRWAAATALGDDDNNRIAREYGQIQDLFDREAVRLDAFLALGERDIEKIKVRFRPRVWYCHMPIVRQVVDFYSRKCSPIHTAQIDSRS